MTHTRTLVGLVALAIAGLIGTPRDAQAAILFEGYSKVMVSGAHVGVLIERYEFDEAKKEFKLAYLLKTTTEEGSMTQSLKARSSASMQPLSYNYTLLAGKTAESIDATFKGEEMTLKIRKGNSLRTEKKKIKKGVFLSRFMVYLMLQSKEGIKTGSKYSYLAIAEEDGGVHPGDALVKGREEIAGESAFQLVSNFKGDQFTGIVTGKGEVLASRSPALGIASEVVANPQDAMAGQGLGAGTLKLVFGDVPAGQENAVARRAAASPASRLEPGKRRRLEEPSATANDGSKSAGLPPGRGIVTKPGAAPESQPPAEPTEEPAQ